MKNSIRFLYLISIGIVLIGGVLGEENSGGGVKGGFASHIPYLRDSSFSPDEFIFFVGDWYTGTNDEVIYREPRNLGQKESLISRDAIFKPVSNKKQVIYLPAEDSKRKTIDFKFQTSDGVKEYKNIELKDPIRNKNPDGFAFENGELVYASFKVAEKLNGQDIKEYQKYKLGDYEYQVPSGSYVEFEKGKNGKPDRVMIFQPDGTEVKPPIVADSNNKNPSEAIVKYEPEARGQLKLPNSDLIKGYGTTGTLNRPREFELFYDTKAKAFFMEKAGLIDGLEIGSIESHKIYLFFNSVPENFQGAYLFFDNKNKRLDIFASQGFETSTVKFLKGNGYGINIERDSDLFIVQATAKNDKKGLVVIKEGNNNRASKIETQGSFSILNGDILLRYDSKEGFRLPVYSKKLNINNKEISYTEEIDLNGKTSVQVQISPKDADGNFIKFQGVQGGEKPIDFDVFIDNNRIIRFTKDEKQKQIFGNVKFGSLDSKTQSIFSSIEDINKQIEILNDENRFKEFMQDSEKYAKENNLRLKEDKKSEDVTPGTTSGTAKDETKTDPGNSNSGNGKVSYVPVGQGVTSYNDPDKKKYPTTRTQFYLDDDWKKLPTGLNADHFRRKVWDLPKKIEIEAVLDLSWFEKKYAGRSSGYITSQEIKNSFLESANDYVRAGSKISGGFSDSDRTHLQNILNIQGLILPEYPKGTKIIISTTGEANYPVIETINHGGKLIGRKTITDINQASALKKFVNYQTIETRKNDVFQGNYMSYWYGLYKGNSR